MEPRLPTFLFKTKRAPCSFLLPLVAAFFALSTPADSDSFYDNYMISWGQPQVVNDTQGVELILDQRTGSGIVSLRQHLFGFFSMRIKLIEGDSAGTVTTFYLTAEGPRWDEIDYEFLGNKEGKPIAVQTNVFVNGTGYREQRIDLWFDPTKDYHNYTVIWNHKLLLFLVDSVPIRVFTNNEDLGTPYPKSKPMRVLCTLWDGSSWATDGGNTKTNWTASPFVASYQGFEISSCGTAGSCNGSWWENAPYTGLTLKQKNQLKWVHKKYMTYDYCNDRHRAPTVPPECLRNGYRNSF